jgi:hypothetical protein
LRSPQGRSGTIDQRLKKKLAYSHGREDNQFIGRAEAQKETMMNWTYAGTHYSSLSLCARAWAESAAPDLSVFSIGDHPTREAKKLMAHSDAEARQSEGGVDLPSRDDESADSSEWDDVRVEALAYRITVYIDDLR